MSGTGTSVGWAFWGRACIAIIFIASGLTKCLTFDKDTGGAMLPAMAPKLDRALGQITKYTGYKVPIERDFYPRILLASAVVEIFGAFLFVGNFSFGAVVLALYVAVMTPILHNFWDERPDSVAQQNQIQHVLKNLSIIGAFIYFLATTDGVPTRKPKTHRA